METTSFNAQWLRNHQFAYYGERFWKYEDDFIKENDMSLTMKNGSFYIYGKREGFFGKRYHFEGFLHSEVELYAIMNIVGMGEIVNRWTEKR